MELADPASCCGAFDRRGRQPARFGWNAVSRRWRASTRMLASRTTPVYVAATRVPSCSSQARGRRTPDADEAMRDAGARARKCPRASSDLPLRCARSTHPVCEHLRRSPAVTPLRSLILTVALAVPCTALAEPQDTEIPGVTAEVAELRTSGGVTRLAVRYANRGAQEVAIKHIEIRTIVLVDVKSKRKHIPIQDANAQYIGGPRSDASGGGRIFLKLQPNQEGVAWTLFEAVPAGTVVNVELPQMFPFDGVPVTEGPGTLLSASSAGSTPFGARATLVSAKRADQALQARLKLAAEPGATVRLTRYFEYKDVYLFDPAGKRRYPLLKDAEGIFQATPMEHRSTDGGRFAPNWSAPILMSLVFQAPPDDVTSVDVMLPDFLPMEGVAIEGMGGAAAGGIAAAGKTLGLEGALKDLEAQVTPEEIKIDLSADVLFDFDKSDLKPAAEEKLGSLLTVVNSRPRATVAIEGHTDVRGEDAYNQALSQRRAESVRSWLVAHGVSAGRIAATGAGEARPVRTGTTEADHQANRRVEIRIKGS
jgi:outer membrane protein OmpA-like peptidoglycan-associated protein